LIEIAEKLGAALISIQGKANSYAAAKLGLTELVNIEGYQSAFVLLSDEEPTQKLTKSLEKIPFVVTQAAYSSQVTANADVVLPVTMWAEQSGTYVNLDGRRQKAVKALDAPDGILTSFEAIQKIADVLNIETDIDWEAELVK
jgi:NADH dehydrogenase/NADH:ubiquinone oxidoreductase subunit G